MPSPSWLTRTLSDDDVRGRVDPRPEESGRSEAVLRGARERGRAVGVAHAGARVARCAQLVATMPAESGSRSWTTRPRPGVALTGAARAASASAERRRLASAPPRGALGLPRSPSPTSPELAAIPLRKRTPTRFARTLARGDVDAGGNPSRIVGGNLLQSEQHRRSRTAVRPDESYDEAATDSVQARQARAANARREPRRAR